MKKSQGFTLIELLAVLVILGVIMTLAVMAYGGYIGKADDTYYDNLADTFKSAVIDYYTDTISALPQNIGDVEEVESVTLIDKNYLESLVDSKNQECTGIGFSKKTATAKYEYSVCLSCPSYNNNQEFGDGCILKDNTNREYSIVSTFPSSYKQGKDASGNFGNTIISIPYADVMAEGNNIISDLTPQPPTINTKVPHDTVYTIYYQYQNKYISRNVRIIDDTNPSSVSISAKRKSTNANYASGSWTNDDVVLTLTASDWTIMNELYGSGIGKIQMSSNDGASWNDMGFTETNNIATATTTITDEGDTVYSFRAVDNAGNTGPITSIRVAIDKTPPKFVSGYPTVTTSDSKGEYNTTTPIINVKATDSVGVTKMCIASSKYSDCVWQDYRESLTYRTLSKHLDGQTYTFYISIRDNIGNVVKRTVNYSVATAGLKCSNYQKKDSVSYAGESWYVLTDNGDTTTLIKKTNSHSNEPYGSKTAWDSSNAKTKVTSWFNSKAKLTLEQRQSYIVEDSTYGIVRIPTYTEANGVSNGSGTPYWSLTPSGSSMRYLTKDGGVSYKTYYVSTQTEVACYYGYKVSGSNYDSLKRYHQDIYAGASYTTIAPPNSTSNYVDWTFKLTYNPCNPYVTDSSGKNPNTGHNGLDPFLNSGPYCADIAPYYGDCNKGTNFCPANASGTDTSSCTSTYRSYSVSTNKEEMGIRPVIDVKERCE